MTNEQIQRFALQLVIRVPQAIQAEGMLRFQDAERITKEIVQELGKISNQVSSTRPADYQRGRNYVRPV